MLMDNSNIWNSLRGIINRFSTDPHLQQDLVQECCLRLWRLEQEQPGQSASWYVQSCRFHIQHYLAGGRSIDSPKRRHAQESINESSDSRKLAVDWESSTEELVEIVSLRDIVTTLARHLKPREQEVLNGLAEGLNLRDIARGLKLSYLTARRHRQKIAGLAIKLGISVPRGRLAHPKPNLRLDRRRRAPVRLASIPSLAPLMIST
jgi:RNA polymerase sigma factor (sigma-70 family)